LDVGCQECKAELKAWITQFSKRKQESLAWIETATVIANKCHMMEKQASEAEYATEKDALEAKHRYNKQISRIALERERVALEHEEEGEGERRTLFWKFAKKKKKKKKAIEARYATKREELEAEYEINRSTLDMNHARSLSTLETKHATKQSALDTRYKTKQEKLEQATEYWTGETMEELMEDVKDQIQLLELHLGGASGNQSNDGITSLVVCPIGGKIMVDPVMAADGYTYERSAMEDHLEKILRDGDDLVSPVTGKPMAHCRLVSNESVRAVASQYA